MIESFGEIKSQERKLSKLPNKFEDENSKTPNAVKKGKEKKEAKRRRIQTGG